MKRYLIIILALTAWFCFNQPTLTQAAYKKRATPAPQPAVETTPANSVSEIPSTPPAPTPAEPSPMTETPAMPMESMNAMMAPASLTAPTEPMNAMMEPAPPATSSESMNAMMEKVPESAANDVGEIAPIIAEGKAVIKGTAEGSPIDGVVNLKQTAEGLIDEAEINNVPNPGKHGFHVHENGSCDEAGKAAGGHYNPDNVPHGDLAHQGHTMAHAGDMGNIVVDDAGKATYSGFLPGVALIDGKYNVNGLAVILHEKEDDFGQPTGNAGGRIGCGIITMEQK